MASDDDEVTPEIDSGVPDVVFVVIADGDLRGGLVLHAAYRHGGSAELHARCVGASAVALQLLERVPASVIDNRVDDFEQTRAATVVAVLSLDDIEG